MKKSPSIIIAANLLLFLLISLSACQSDEQTNTQSSTGNNNDESDGQAHDHSKHDHGDLEVSSFGEKVAIPTISFTIEKDSMSGWNIHINTEHFRFAPEHVNADASPGEGHAHIYIDGYKIARLYGNWFHLQELTPGEHEVSISLNANDHSNWSHQGQVIAATQTIIQD